MAEDNAPDYAQQVFERDVKEMVADARRMNQLDERTTDSTIRATLDAIANKNDNFRHAFENRDTQPKEFEEAWRDVRPQIGHSIRGTKGERPAHPDGHTAFNLSDAAWEEHKRKLAKFNNGGA